MDIGKIVSWIQTAIWLFAAAVFVIKLVRGESKIHPWLKWALSSNGLLRIVIVLGLILSGFSLYLSYHPKSGMNLKATADAWATYRYEYVIGRHFFNEAVVLDGKHFSGCTFENVTFIYQGKGPVQVVDSRLIRHPDSVVKWHTDNILVQQTARIMKGLGQLPPGYRDEEVPLEIPKD